MRERGRWTWLTGVMLALLLVAGAGCSDDGSDDASDDGSSATTTTEAGATETTTRGGGEVASEVLAEVEPPQAPGFTMYLYRVEIPPGAAIEPHHHPGQQMARIESGTLTYTVIEGTLLVGRDGSPEADEEVAAGETVQLEPGDSVFEDAGMVHEAANEGDEPVLIVLSALFPTGDDLSIPEDEAA